MVKGRQESEDDDDPDLRRLAAIPKVSHVFTC